MTAGIKPGELQSGDIHLDANPNAIAKAKPQGQVTTTPNKPSTQTQPATPTTQADISE